MATDAVGFSGVSLFVRTRSGSPENSNGKG